MARYVLTSNEVPFVVADDVDFDIDTLKADGASEYASEYGMLLVYAPVVGLPADDLREDTIHLRATDGGHEIYYLGRWVEEQGTANEILSSWCG